MRIHYTLSSVLKFLVRTISILASAFLLAGALVSTASASHFRGGQVSWIQAGGNTVNVTLQQAWRRNSFSVGFACVDISGEIATPPFTSCTGFEGDGLPNVGDVTRFFSSFRWGDPSASTRIYLLVTSIDPDNNWLYGIAIDPVTGDTFLSHTYTTSGDYTAFFDSCCRIGPVTNLQNNANGRFRVETVINVATSNNSPEVIGLPPIVICALNRQCDFSIPATDPDAGDTLSYRFSTIAEASGTGSFTQPPGATMSMTGNFSWFTPATSTDDLYSTQVTIDDGTGVGRSKIAVDFLIELADPVVANDDTAGDADGPATGELFNIDVLMNDDVPAGVLTVEIISGPATGTATVKPDFTVDYTSDVTHDGTDEFEYRVTANNLLSDTATVFVNILTNESVVPASSSPTKFFDQADAEESDNPQTAGYMETTQAEPGIARITCCAIDDIREDAGKNNKGKGNNSDAYQRVHLDIGEQVADTERNPSCDGMPPIAPGTAMLPAHLRSMPSTLGIPPTEPLDHKIGICNFQTEGIVSRFIVYSEENLKHIPGLRREYSCDHEHVDDGLLAGGVSTTKPEEVEVGPVTVECDRGRSGKANPGTVYVYGIRHDTNILKSKQYGLGLFNATIHAINAATCVDNSQGFVTAVRNLVQGARSHLENPRNGKKNPANGNKNAQDAVDKVDAATKLTLGIGASPPDPFASCTANEEGDYLGLLMTTRYAICREMVHRDDFDADKLGGDDDCLIDPVIRSFLPDL